MRTLMFIGAVVVSAVMLGGQGSALAVGTEPGSGAGAGGRTASANEITRLVGRLAVGEPWEVRNMVVFPLSIDGPTDPTRYVTLDEAIKNGWLKVYEKGQGRVQEVIVRNLSRHYVFLMAGEIVSGARQNRVIATDTLLRPHGPEVAVPVYCVERGRWSGRTMGFTTEKSFANNRLRYKAQSRAGQSEVWDEVARVSKDAGVRSKTSNFQDVVKDKGVQKELGEYGKIMPEPPRRCVGAVIVISNRIAGVEIFANEALFAALWPKLRRGYALDAYPTSTRWEIHKKEAQIEFVDAADVNAFLDRVYRARFSKRGGVDLGVLYAIAGNRIVGEGLVFESNVIHVNFAPVGAVIHPVKPGVVLEHRTR